MSTLSIDKKERTLLLVVLIILAIWFTLGVSYLYKISSSNSSLFYFLFLVGYALFINKFIFNNGFVFKKVFSLFIIILVGDILLPPYILQNNVMPDVSLNLKFSADMFTYNLLPLAWNHTLKYLMVYILIPVILLGILSYINDRNKFMSLIKRGGV